MLLPAFCIPALIRMTRIAVSCWLSRGKGARTAYLSATRGDGGQNLLGTELFEALGVIRTEELLAARRADHAQQFFTPVYEFGFSKSADEAFEKWGRDALLGDFVRVIRQFRPEIIVSRFRGTSADGHGHHQAAGIMTQEAFKAAADPARFPEYGKPWQAKKLYLNAGEAAAGKRNTQAQASAALLLPSLFPSTPDEFDLALGRSYAEIAAEGRSLHRSQGQGSVQNRGPSNTSLQLVQKTVDVADGADLFAGVLYKLPDLAQLEPSLGADLNQLEQRVNTIRQKAGISKPSDLVPDLMAALKQLQQIRTRVDKRACRGSCCERKESRLSGNVEARRRPGSRRFGRGRDRCSRTGIRSHRQHHQRRTLHLFRSVRELRPASILAGHARPATDRGRRARRTRRGGGARGAGAAPGGAKLEVRKAVRKEVEAARRGGRGGGHGPCRSTCTAWGRRSGPEYDQVFTIKVPASAAFTQPYWLREPRKGDRFVWPQGSAVNMPFDPALLMTHASVTYDGTTIVMEKAAEFRSTDRVYGEERAQVKVVPALSVRLVPDVAVIPIGGKRQKEFTVHIENQSTTPVDGNVRLVVPNGWTVTPPTQAGEIYAAGREDVDAIHGHGAGSQRRLQGSCDSQGRFAGIPDRIHGRRLSAHRNPLSVFTRGIHRSKFSMSRPASALWAMSKASATLFRTRSSSWESMSQCSVRRIWRTEISRNTRQLFWEYVRTRRARMCALTTNG